MTKKRNPLEDMQMGIDDRILEILSESQLTLNPAVIAYNIGYSREEVNRRLSELEKMGLIEREKRGYYSINKTGERYLEGEDISDS